MEEFDTFLAFLKNADDQFVKIHLYTPSWLEEKIHNIYKEAQKENSKKIYPKILELYNEKIWSLSVRSLLEEFLFNFSPKNDKPYWLKSSLNGYFEEVAVSLSTEILKDMSDKANAALRKMWRIAFLLKKYFSMLNIQGEEDKLTSLIEKACFISPNSSSFDHDRLYSLIYLAAFCNLSSLPCFLKLLSQIKNKDHNVYKILLAPSHPPLLSLEFFPVYIFDSQNCWNKKEQKNTSLNLSKAVQKIDLKSVKEGFFNEQRKPQFFATCRDIINYTSHQELKDKLKKEIPSEEMKHWNTFFKESHKSPLSSKSLLSSFILSLIPPVENAYSLKDALNILCKSILNHAKQLSCFNLFEFLIHNTNVIDTRLIHHDKTSRPLDHYECFPELLLSLSHVFVKGLESVKSHFDTSDWVLQDLIPVIDQNLSSSMLKGVKYAFQGDYEASIYLLGPLVEGWIRFAFAELNIGSESIEKVLNKSEIIAFLGENNTYILKKYFFPFIDRLTHGQLIYSSNKYEFHFNLLIFFNLILSLPPFPSKKSLTILKKKFEFLPQVSLRDIIERDTYSNINETLSNIFSSRTIPQYLKPTLYKGLKYANNIDLETGVHILIFSLEIIIFKLVENNKIRFREEGRKAQNQIEHIPVNNLLNHHSIQSRLKEENKQWLTNDYPVFRGNIKHRTKSCISFSSYLKNFLCLTSIINDLSKE